MTSKKQLENPIEDIEGENPEKRVKEVKINHTFVDKYLNVTGGEVHRTEFDENMNGETEVYELRPENAELIAGGFQQSRIFLFGEKILLANLFKETLEEI
ncbi:hypothetical protein AKJ41_01685 [candidate division MSBL1 archaeon SCGC-AAA259O05]|uniref:Uncharacterized protein n=1 Tax=candidate division MSBL1 archaeon SCGC-AAA259O05 TaxID=1698271 RepID=A0A133V4L6_9EURY|nr:hypothetical protein AKJ41_01685 [candidate division MSBL1 archaeon SCGC-AAA259O05]